MVIKGNSEIGEYSFDTKDLNITVEVKVKHPDLVKWHEHNACSGIESSCILEEMLKKLFPNFSMLDEADCADMYSSDEKDKARMVITFQGK